MLNIKYKKDDNINNSGSTDTKNNDKGKIIIFIIKSNYHFIVITINLIGNDKDTSCLDC